jgi:hypothetical protein
MGRRMSIRRSASALVTFTILSTCVMLAPIAGAQQPNVQLRLVDQTPWTTKARPVLKLTVEATNAGTEPLTDLTAELVLGSAIHARLVYEQSLTEGPGLPIAAPAFPQDGTFDSGTVRRFTVSVDVSRVAGVSTIDSLVYPAQFGLLSAGEPVATLDTAEIHFVRTPEQPLLFSSWAEIDVPVAMDPSGHLARGDLEASVAPGGALRSEVEALRELVGNRGRLPVDVVVEPALLDQLSAMSDGYERDFAGPVPRGEGAALDAATILSTLRSLASSPNAELSAMPYSAPLLPSLMSPGLVHDLDVQRTVGADTVTRLLGVSPDPAVIRPPGGAVDDASLQALASGGVETVLGDAETVERPSQPNDFAPPPTAILPAGAGLNVVLPDPHVSALLEDPVLLTDPVRAAQALLGEIVAIWREQPAPIAPIVRGIALGLPATLPAGLWEPLLKRIAGAPFLQTTHASDFVTEVNPPAAAASLSSPSTAGFTRAYAAAIRTERDSVAAYRSMLIGASTLPDQLDRNLLFAEAGQYVGDEVHGRAWYDQVHGVVSGVFARAAPDTSQAFTFTSRIGTIPIRMGDPGSTPLKMILILRSARYTFPNGDEQAVTLTHANQIVPFQVEANASGQGAIEVIVRAPSGRIVSQEALFVRSTSVSRIALIITAVAALVLAALWSRRLFLRRTS